MPNTKSAERRMRGSAPQAPSQPQHKSSLHQLEKKYVALLASGKKEDARASLRAVTSAFDKAANNGVIHKSMASRKSPAPVRLMQ